MAQICYYLLLQSGGRILLQAGSRIRLHIDCIAVGASGRKKKLGRYYSWHLEEGWYKDKIAASEQYMAKEMARLAARREAMEEERVTREEKTIDEIRVAGVGIEFDVRARIEEKEYSGPYAKKREQQLTGYERMMASQNPSRVYRTKEDIRFDAKRAAKKRMGDEKQERLSKSQTKKTAIINLEKANIAKEKKKKREEEIYQQRLKNLKKARAAKRRKAKKMEK